MEHRFVGQVDREGGRDHEPEQGGEEPFARKGSEPLASEEIDVFQLVQDANKRVQDIREIKRLLPPMDAVFALGEFTELEYYEKDDTDPTKQAVMLIDGVRTIGEVLLELLAQYEPAPCEAEPVLAGGPAVGPWSAAAGLGERAY